MALRRPASKIGRSTLGVKFHAPLPLPNRSLSSALALPKAPVKVMRGKNAARAAPILALAACS
ncbi:hypothetical protein D3C72_1918970 [compost metagenome]